MTSAGDHISADPERQHYGIKEHTLVVTMSVLAGGTLLAALANSIAVLIAAREFPREKAAQRIAGSFPKELMHLGRLVDFDLFEGPGVPSKTLKSERSERVLEGTPGPSS